MTETTPFTPWWTNPKSPERDALRIEIDTSAALRPAQFPLAVLYKRWMTRERWMHDQKKASIMGRPANADLMEITFDRDADLPRELLGEIPAIMMTLRGARRKRRERAERRKKIDYSLFEKDGITAPAPPVDGALEFPEPPPPTASMIRPAKSIVPSLEIVKYGLKFPPGTNPLTIELAAYRLKRTPEQGGLGTFRHCKNIIDMLWNRPNSPVRFDWTPWAEQFLRAACEHQYVAVGGCAGSGKSYSAAVLAIIDYLCSPHNTIVILTSTTLREAKKRIWKGISEYWSAVPGLPGKMVDSLGQLKGFNRQGEPWEGSGIVLVPAEKKSEKDAIGKLIGIHQDRVILCLDEATELPESILHAAKSNLSQNPYFSMRALGNPSSYYDTFAKMAKPTAGWASVSEDDYEWDIEGGKFIRFDAEDSPNVLAGREIYKYLPTREKIESIRAEYGEKSLYFYRMVRGFFPPEGVTSGVYSEADFARGVAGTKAEFKGETEKVAGLDISFSSGGDRTIAYFGQVGKDASGTQLMQFDEYVAISEDITSSVPRPFQVAMKFIELCRARGVRSRNAGVDATSGGGSTFCDVLAICWGVSDFLRVNFSGNASNRPVSGTDRTPGHDKYKNRMTEIWYLGSELVRSRQLRGVGPDLATELVSRNYMLVDGGKRVQVERKVDYIARIGKSPDIADAALILLTTVRERFGLVGTERFEASTQRQDVWKKKMRRLDSVFRPVNLHR